VRHHLKHNLGRAQCSVVFVGYAASGTLARQIIDGAKSVGIFGEDYPVRASVHTIGGFSAHAGQDELLAWHQQTGTPDTTFLVHGEPEAMTTLGQLLGETRVEMPRLRQDYRL
jgi:metallo-beta-lactamase family protein